MDTYMARKYEQHIKGLEQLESNITTAHEQVFSKQGRNDDELLERYELNTDYSELREKEIDDYLWMIRMMNTRDKRSAKQVFMEAKRKGIKLLEHRYQLWKTNCGEDFGDDDIINYRKFYCFPNKPSAKDYSSEVYEDYEDTIVPVEFRKGKGNSQVSEHQGKERDDMGDQQENVCQMDVEEEDDKKPIAKRSRNE